jgi:hypothetical protein
MRRGFTPPFPFASEESLSAQLRDRKRTMLGRIEAEPESFLAQVSEQDYVAYLTSEFAIDVPHLDFDRLTVDSDERDIPAEQYPDDSNVRPGKSYRRPVVIYQIPYSGNEVLAHYAPRMSLGWQPHVYFKGDHLCFDIVDLRDDPGAIKSEAERNIDALRRQSEYLIRDIEAFNQSLEGDILAAMRARKETFLKKNNLMAALGVPIYKRDNVPQTFAIPMPTPRKIVVTRPEVREAGYKPEPTLDEAIYQGILRIISEVGKSFERKPSTYHGKDEEDLRDHLLLYLEQHYDQIGSATGETFNKAGKTDILVRYENNNVFIAECKFWSGQKNYLKTITQLLDYLTWRDSKAAVVIFDRNRDVSTSLRAIELATPKHSNYLGFVSADNQGRFNYRFHINGDRNREVHLAILVFHLPKLRS